MAQRPTNRTRRTYSYDEDRRRTRSCDENFGGVADLFGALAEGVVELVAGSARFAGNVVGDLADDCVGSTIRRDRGTESREGEVLDEDGERDGRACGCNVTGSSFAEDCIHVLDRAVGRIDHAWDERRSEVDDTEAGGAESTVRRSTTTRTTTRASGSSGTSSDPTS